MSESETNVQGNNPPLHNETPHHNETSHQISDVSSPSSPYFLHSADHPGAVLVSNSLTGDNYITWKRAMKMALNAKNKFGFVDGSLTRPTLNSTDLHLWERCNDMVLSWILNSIDKSLINNVIYYNNPREIWINLEERFSQGNNPRIFKLKRDISIAAYYNIIKSY
jgi:hypothetical protein